MGSFREEFTRTENTLARHQAAIKERLIDAAIAGIAHLSSNEHELQKMPEDLRTRFLEFTADLTKSGSIHSTVRAMSVGEAQMMVDRFLSLAYEVSQLQE
jgi:hypothetical protein